LFPLGKALYREIKKSARESQASKNALLLMLLVNLYTIATAVVDRWPIENVVLVYWLQNIAVGVFTCLKFFFWKNIEYATDKRYSVIVFVVGFFGVHALILFSLTSFPDTGLMETFHAVRYFFALFVANHAVSFVLNYRQDTERPTTYAHVCESAVIRIFPLYLWPGYVVAVFVPGYMLMMVAYLLGVNETLLSNISSAFPAFMLILFMVLKAIFEIPAHLVTHSGVRPVKRAWS
jgi:hypothetical protein